MDTLKTLPTAAAPATLAPHTHGHADDCGCGHDHHDHGHGHHHHHATQGTVRRAGPKVGRNDPCLCGSGKKHKKCCGA